MAFFIKQDENWYLKDTGIENIFINEYMTQAPGDYVKIYILALMYAKMGADISNEAIAKSVGVEEEDVLKAWIYWESQGAVIKKKKEGAGRFSYDVEFVSLKTASKTGNAAAHPAGHGLFRPQNAAVSSRDGYLASGVQTSE